VTRFEWRLDIREATTTDADGVKVFDGYKSTSSSTRRTATAT
jgi:hypothetical protein